MHCTVAISLALLESHAGLAMALSRQFTEAVPELEVPTLDALRESVDRHHNDDVQRKATIVPRTDGSPDPEEPKTIGKGEKTGARTDANELEKESAQKDSNESKQLPGPVSEKRSSLSMDEKDTLTSKRALAPQMELSTFRRRSRAFRSALHGISNRSRFSESVYSVHCIDGLV